MQVPTLEEMLKAGVHFGHQRAKWNPKSGWYVFQARKGVHIIDLEQTQKRLEIAVAFVQDVVQKGGIVLFVGTKRQAKQIVKKHAKRAGMPFMVERWLGGTFTNFNTIKKQIRRLNDLSKRKEEGKLTQYTKREQLQFDREITRLEKFIGGIKNQKKLPEAIFVVDVNSEKNAIAEAKLSHVPVVALTDTNVDPNAVDYPIPSNDDAIKVIDLMVGVVADAIMEVKPQTDSTQKTDSTATQNKKTPIAADQARTS